MSNRFPELITQEDIDREQRGGARMLGIVILGTICTYAGAVLWWFFW